tara:strand:- start:247 stop:495 length:249 start_codon:yes stop_codon:yes gene_type:complete
VRVLGLALVVRGSSMTSTFVPVVLGYKVTTLDASGFTLQFIFKFHMFLILLSITGLRLNPLIYKGKITFDNGVKLWYNITLH